MFLALARSRQIAIFPFVIGPRTALASCQGTAGATAAAARIAWAAAATSTTATATVTVAAATAAGRIAAPATTTAATATTTAAAAATTTTSSSSTATTSSSGLRARRTLRRAVLAEQKSQGEYQDQRQHPPQPTAIFLFRSHRILRAAFDAKPRLAVEFGAAMGAKGFHGFKKPKPAAQPAMAGSSALLGSSHKQSIGARHELSQVQ
jgi:hypothetical protein